MIELQYTEGISSCRAGEIQWESSLLPPEQLCHWIISGHIFAKWAAIRAFWRGDEGWFFETGFLYAALKPVPEFALYSRLAFKLTEIHMSLSSEC